MKVFSSVLDCMGAIEERNRLTSRPLYTTVKFS
jgi:hypothetical protein